MYLLAVTFVQTISVSSGGADYEIESSFSAK